MRSIIGIFGRENIINISRGGAGEYGYLTNKYPALKASYVLPVSYL
jgi:hypothetical protein